MTKGFRNKDHWSPPEEDQNKRHRMPSITWVDCAVMCNLIYAHPHTTPPWEDQCEWYWMTRMALPDCAVMCYLVYTHASAHAHTHIAIVNPRANFNLENTARHAGKHLADAVERKEIQVSRLVATYSLLLLTTSTCGEVSSEVYALINSTTRRWERNLQLRRTVVKVVRL